MAMHCTMVTLGLIGLFLLALACSATWAQGPAGRPEAATRPAIQPPTDFVNVPYGPHPRNDLNFWKAPSDKPTPLFIHIHGGGFFAGDKAELKPDACAKYLRAGISVASINYRLSSDALYPAQMLDGARAVQFLRSKAAEWNLDPHRFAACGGSAGAGISMWLAFHDDLADPKSADPIARQSTRLTCVLAFDGQTSYDPRFIKEHLPGKTYMAPGVQKLFGLKEGEQLTPTPQTARLFEDAAPINHLTADDPPAFLIYGMSLQDTRENIHHPIFGQLLKAKMDALKIECVLQTRDTPAADKVDPDDFLFRHLGVEHREGSRRVVRRT